MLRLTLRARIIVWNAAIVAILMALLAVVSFIRVKKSVYSSIDETLVSRSEKMFGLRDPMGQLQSDDQLLRIGTAEVVQMLTRPKILTASGQSASQYRGDKPWDEEGFLQALRGKRGVFTEADSGEGAVRVYSRPVVDHKGKVRFVLQHVYLLNQAEAAVDAVKMTYLAVAPMALLAIIGAAFVLAQRAVAPIARMAEQAGSLTANSLGTRLDQSGGDEISALGHAFNRLLDRLQSAFEQQRRVIDSQRNFIADASNELRAPIELIKQNADQGKDAPDSQPFFEAIRSSADETDQLVAQMLSMARAESRLGDYDKPLDIFSLLLDSYERWEPVFGERLTLKASRKLPPVLGDERQLKEAVDNLIQNCARYAPNSDVSLSAAEEAGFVKVEISDNGPGIPLSDRERVFDRFYRGQADKHIQGAGLGLAIAREIIEAHGGTIRAYASVQGGAAIGILLPAAPASE